jgi:hypothetical protein
MKDLIEAAREKPGDLKVGGTYAPGVDAIVAYLIGKETGTQFNYIPFKKGEGSGCDHGKTNRAGTGYSDPEGAGDQCGFPVIPLHRRSAGHSPRGGRIL